MATTPAHPVDGSLTLDLLAAEFRLLCRAARPSAAALVPTEVGLDWQAWMDGALRHRIAPQILASLGRGGASALPAAILAELKSKVTATARRNLGWLVETHRLIGALAEAGIRTLVLKGGALSLQLYGDPAMRQFGDIDLLVEPGALWRADEIAIRFGYRREATAPHGAGRAMHEEWVKDLSYSSDRWHLELHHRLADNPLLLPHDFEALWVERETVRAGALSLPTLPRRFLALYLCVHGADHGWERLGWLSDMAALLQSPASQTAALDDAQARGLTAIMIQALHLAHDWLGLPLHDPRLALDRAAERRLRRFAASFSPGSGGGLRARSGRSEWRFGMVLHRHVNRYRLRTGWRYRLRQLRGDLACPQDWEAFPLPARLSWLYPLLRPFGWIIRHAAFKKAR